MFPRSANFDSTTLKFDDLSPSSRGHQAVETTNAVAYCRVSSEIQAKEWHGLEWQISACEEYAQGSKLCIDEIFVDKAVSWSITERKWLIDLEKFIKKKNKHPSDKNIKYLLCTEISRLSRPEFIDEGLGIIFKLLRLGITIIDVFSWQSINRANDLELILAFLKVSQAKSERDNIMARTQNGRNKRLKKWYWCFPLVPMGYKYVRDTIDGKTNSLVVRDEPNASKIAKALNLYAIWAIRTKRDLVDHLQKVWVYSNKTRWGKKKMRFTIVYSLLKPERLLFYAGKIVSPRCGITEPIEWKHKPLINDKTLKLLFDRIQKPLEKLPQKSPNVDEFPLRRILKCANCGSTMYWSFVRSKTGKKYPFYECKNKTCSLREEKISRSCPIHLVHQEIRDVLATFQISDEEKALVKVIAERLLKERHKLQEESEDELKSQIKIISESMQKFKNTMISISSSSLIKEYENERNNYAEQKEKLKNKLENIKNWWSWKKFYELLDKALKYFDKLVDVWDEWTVENKRILIQTVFDGKIFYSKKGGFRTPFKLVRNWRFFLYDMQNSITKRSLGAVSNITMRLERLY